MTTVDMRMGAGNGKVAKLYKKLVKLMKTVAIL